MPNNQMKEQPVINDIDNVPDCKFEDLSFIFKEEEKIKGTEFNSNYGLS